MNRSPLLLAIFICAITTMYSQDYTIGLKGGINQNNIGDFYSIGGSIGSGVPDEYFPAENEIGHQYGIFFNVQINYFFIRTEVNFVSLENFYDFPTKPAKWAAKQIDIPILFGYNIYRPVSIYSGLIFSSITEMTMGGWEDTGYPGTAPFTYMNSSTSISAGVLVEFGRFAVDFRYQYGLSPVLEQRLDMIKTFEGYGVNLGDLVEYNSSQYMLSLQVDLFSFGGGRNRNNRFKSDWRNHKNLR